MSGSEWKELRWAEDWPSFREGLPHAGDAERMLTEHLIGGEVGRFLDLGSGDGRVIALLRERWPDAAAIGLDLSPALTEEARQRFAGTDSVRVEEHDLMQPLPGDLGRFDLVVSALAIHHLPDKRKKELFAEVFSLLRPNGAFYDLDVVAAPTAELHELSQAAFGFDARQQDPSDQPARLEDQLGWLREAGFSDVDCHWKWLELSLVGGTKRAGAPSR
jgi:tRNA (cmo5U34)-methyltransferase